MASSPARDKSLADRLAKNGLTVFGAFRAGKSDSLTDLEIEGNSCCILVGNAGAGMWPHFEASSEYSDGLKDPLNRWSEQILGALADDLGCRVLFPFTTPALPFQQFARLAMDIKASPLGILIHPDYGLWHAFRGLLVFGGGSAVPDDVEKLIQEPQKMIHPCERCIEKPCLSACPVSAFSSDGLDVAACFKHIDTGENPNCMELGCCARDACPIGNRYRYGGQQIRFHMHSYRN